MKSQKSKKQSRIYLVGGLLAGLLVPIIGHYSPKIYNAVFSISISFIIAALIAFVISTLYIKRGRFNKRLLGVLFWSNVVAWIIPDLGFLVGTLTNQINFQNYGKDRRKYMLLGSLGIVLSLLHFIVSIARHHKL